MTSCPEPTSSAALVVDAGAEINALLDNVLAGSNWSVERVPDNHAVLSRITTKPFDLIITSAETRLKAATATRSDSSRNITAR